MYITRKNIACVGPKREKKLHKIKPNVTCSKVKTTKNTHKASICDALDDHKIDICKLSLRLQQRQTFILLYYCRTYTKGEVRIKKYQGGNTSHRLYRRQEFKSRNRNVRILCAKVSCQQAKNLCTQKNSGSHLV